MDTTTLFLAQLIGPSVLAIGLGIFFSSAYYKKVYRDLESETFAVMMGGLTILIAGIVMVLNHNIWDSFFAGLISLIGWMSILKGLTLLIVPKMVDEIGNKIAASNLLPAAGVLYTVIGAYLSYMAYLA